MKIAIYAFSGITMFHLSVPLLVFGEVKRLGLAPDWNTMVWTESGQPVTTAEGMLIDGVVGPDEVKDADMVVIPSWPAELPRVSDSLKQTLTSAQSAGTLLVGLCLGAFPLASSGVLNGRKAVTHWAKSREFGEQNPFVTVDPSALYIDHGDMLTSAGTASALDACLHIVRTRLGSTAATELARHLVLAPHREGGQAQYVRRPIPPQDGQDPISKILQWAAGNLREPLSVDDLAARACMSKRHFNRVFHDATGSSPAKWIRALRLDHARSLLEATDLGVAKIAEECGFDSAVTFRQRFVAEYATTPSSYRRRFGDTEDLKKGSN
ncbi:transcriptional regulator GlxA family with amidase domain [Arthrobacter sp. V4I6]|uniref:GlxA family transcriptional regulator n=1 Tax=unclassified Arthrobacter TaxID=235627 RepID=UPI00277D62DE|nr:MULTISPECIES: helix-turn-helix domain-containing protein [unclassified Arthrobacter]MDQ0821728.1 transcriptional regulator GlxA family with amidase domain [Arthrobacter sp. V1I7]MDQ0855992.1 transcriptional regulator GlxA family with amidase domain [Arthrobacter sp. V4I6]